jgi:hypothetical protein
MELANMLVSDGYVGSTGVSYHPPTADELEQAITGAIEIEGKTRDEIVAILESGKSVRWCTSANFYYDHSYGKIGRKRAVPPVVIVHCDCGHDVPVGSRMSASLGTSCPDCYDRMSE